jgi:dynein heavy chain
LSGPDKVTGLQVQLPPALEQFGEQLSHHRKSHSNIRLIQDSKSFGWLRVDYRPLKQSLDFNLGKWVYLFSHYLNNDMVKSLAEFDVFVEEATRGLEIKINKGDYHALVAVLEAMFLVRSNQPKYDKLYEYLNQVVNLLKQYRVTVTDTLFNRIEAGPARWLELKNLWTSVQDRTGPLQQEETTRLRNNEEAFVENLNNSREKISEQQFFK